MAKKTYLYGQAPTDSAKAATPKITKTIQVYIPRKASLTDEQKEKAIVNKKMTNDEKIKYYGLSNSTNGDVKRKDALKITVKTLEKKPLDSEMYEKSLNNRKKSN